MPSSSHPRLAVIADAHFHDLYGSYGLPESGGTAFRSLADTARSVRLLNESYAALVHTLDDVVARGITHVILLGDYSDDGQVATLAGLRRILDRYSTQCGLRFYAVVGNHDIFGPDGRHRTKRFMNATGSYVVATSNPALSTAAVTPTVVSKAMYCQGYPAGLSALSNVGFFGSPDALYWETPFGQTSEAAARLYPVWSEDGTPHRPLMDASYLVEPFEGVWLMMIDANVFRPYRQADRADHGQDYADSTTAGWNAVLTHKPFLLTWMTDVADRAKALGKQLLTFSHYPVLDPLDGTGHEEQTTLGVTSFAGRIPGPTVARAMTGCGIGVHFSGHLHINDTARYQDEHGFLINVSVPSLVAFPSAYKIITVGIAALEVETVEIGTMPLDPEITARYRQEMLRAGLKLDRLVNCANYGQFTHEHIGHLVGRRYLRRDWPQDLAVLFQTSTLADLAALAGSGTVADRAVEPLANISSLSFLEDWYRFRLSSDLDFCRLPEGRLAAYRLVAALFASDDDKATGKIQRHVGLIFEMFLKYMTGLPARNFSIDLVTGDIRLQTDKQVPGRI